MDHLAEGRSAKGGTLDDTDPDQLEYAAIAYPAVQNPNHSRDMGILRIIALIGLPCLVVAAVIVVLF